MIGVGRRERAPDRGYSTGQKPRLFNRAEQEKFHASQQSNEQRCQNRQPERVDPRSRAPDGKTGLRISAGRRKRPLSRNITDRDIAIRAVAEGKSASTKVRDVMSTEVKYCFEDDDLEQVSHNMADLKVRRLPVLNHDKRLVGIVSLGDIALTDGAGGASDALCGISEPGGQHSQSIHGDGARAR